MSLLVLAIHVYTLYAMYTESIIDKKINSHACSCNKTDECILSSEVGSNRTL